MTAAGHKPRPRHAPSPRTPGPGNTASLMQTVGYWPLPPSELPPEEPPEDPLGAPEVPLGLLLVPLLDGPVPVEFAGACVWGGLAVVSLDVLEPFL